MRDRGGEARRPQGGEGAEGEGGGGRGWPLAVAAPPSPPRRSPLRNRTRMNPPPFPPLGTGSGVTSPPSPGETNTKIPQFDGNNADRCCDKGAHLFTGQITPPPICKSYAKVPN